MNTPAIRHGRENEKIAIEQLKKQENLTIKPSGLFIDREICYLGATPDGLIGENGILEMKCPYSAHNMVVDDAISNGKLPYFKKEKKKGEIVFNKGNNYQYQIQGQLHIAEKDYCIFAVWTSTDLPLKVVTISKDNEFWDKSMKEKLTDLYTLRLLPEIIDPRHSRNMEIRNCEQDSKIVENTDDK